MAPLSQSSAATRSATGYPTSTRTSGPRPTPSRPLSRSRTGPAEMPIHGWGAAAARASASISIASPSRREDEGVRDEHFAAALRNGEAPGLDLGSDAGLHGPVAQRGLLRVRFRHRPGRIDGPGGHQLSGEVRLARELRLVAGADLRAVVVDDLADQLGVDGADHFRLAGTEPDLAVLLAAKATLPVAIIGEPAADAVGSDPRETEAGAVAAAPAPTERLETHATIAVRFARLGTGEVPHRVPRALLQRDAENVALPRPAAQRLQQPGLRDQRAIVHLPLGPCIAARRRLAARLAFLAQVARHGLSRIAARLVDLLGIENGSLVRLRRSRAHDQRPRLDQLRLSGAHLRRGDAGAPELHADDHQDRGDAGDEYALPVRLLAADARSPAHPA